MKQLIFTTAAMWAALTAAAPAPHPMGPDDIARLQAVSDPQVDPSGTWVAYAVAGTDEADDKTITHLWMTRWDGTGSVQLTSRAKESETTPRWSPDGRWLAFISSRADELEDDALWLLDRRGGEARKLEGITGSVADVVWSPDSKTLALVIDDPDPDRKANAAASAALPSAVKPGTATPPTTSPGDMPPPSDSRKPDEKRPKPIVIDRFQFKQDVEGYKRTQRKRLWRYDLATSQVSRLTNGNYDEVLPAFAPDGRTIAFVSKHGTDPDRTYNWDIYTIASNVAAAEPHAVTTFEGDDADPDWNSYPAWSPDGHSIAYLQGGPIKLFSYGVRTLAVISAAGGSPRILTAALDRNVSNPSWTANGRALRFRIEDDGIERIGEVSAIGGPVRPVIGGARVFSAFASGPNGHDAVLMTDPAHPAEIYAIDHGKLRALSQHNDNWLKTVTLGAVTQTRLRSKDGTEVHGFVVSPSGAVPSKPRPLVLFNHGGPQSQFDLSFNPNWQIFAGAGYVVVSANPRGSTGRGQAFAAALYADWGGPAVPDALAAVDDAVAHGLADPNRLFVGGWSYGGMLTNYLIASDTRFKAAVSGASIANVFAGYGTDQYIRDYEAELGRPWENPAAWQRVSYPFYHNETVITPTLFMAGDKDFNVPLLNSEQMYQALRSRGIETRLIIYPGQFHGLTRPSFLKDRMQRWLSWYELHRGISGAP